jgi:predicted membrane-bound dolichyl-phosphate-mannose-protein mannosyltransferase
LSASTVPVVTAGLRPELFNEPGARSLSRTIVAVALSVLVMAGLGFRLTGLSGEGLSEDELNKLVAVNDYRAHGITSANGEHPFLMKAMLAVSVVAAEKWNHTSLASAHPEWQVPVETALRMPNAIFGALTAILIYLLAAELFGFEIALIAAALWAFDPLAISFNRIAKEDTLLTFFFVLACVFWVRGQTVAENQTRRNPEPFYWATAVALGAMMASKYLPQVIAILVAYNYAFQAIPATRWRMGKKRFLKFFVIMGLSFLLFNPTILLPETWRMMKSFANFQVVGHDSYEFMGKLYKHRGIDWLRGQPWYFYFVMMAVKMPLLTLLGFVLGAPLLFRRRLGDGRYLLLFWIFIWGLTFVLSGGKFTRYFTFASPAVVITAAIGAHFAARWLAGIGARAFGDGARIYVRAAVASIAIMGALWSATNAMPHYRLYVNALGGGTERAGSFFPQDEFYDAYMRDAMGEIAKRAGPGARVASEIPTLATYYAQRANRSDLVCLEMSDPAAIQKLTLGDFVIDARGRTYFSNQAMLTRLREATKPAFTIAVGATPAADVYALDQKALDALHGRVSSPTVREGQ